MRCKPSFFSAIATSMIVLAIAPPMFAEPLNPNEVLIDRDPIPVTPPRSQFIPSSPPPVQTIPATPTVPTSALIIQPTLIPYDPQLAALVPPAAINTVPYLVVIPSSDEEVLNRVRSGVPTAKIISSRFGNIIMVQGYPDRDRAEVLRAIMRSSLGLDARVVHQNSL